MSVYLESLLQDEAQRVYHWQQQRLYPVYPSPMSIQASRAIVREASLAFSLNPPRVRIIPDFMTEYDGVGGLCHKVLDRLYFRTWVNKAIVLHEFTHYLALKRHGNLIDDHGQEFIESFADVISWAGLPILARELLDEWRSSDIA